MNWFIGLALLLCFPMLKADDSSREMVVIPQGPFTPFFKEIKERDQIVSSFKIDKYPVSNLQFNEFLVSHPELRKNKIISLYADQRYLQEWKSEILTEGDLKSAAKKPVTAVSWFVAKKYCQSIGKRLPTIAEWEYASDAMNPEILNDLLAWYAKTGDLPIGEIGRKPANKFGAYDFHGLIWEWVEDFSSVMISSDSRSKGDRTDGFFCGGGSVSSLDAKSYATFMRYGFRSGLKGDYSMRNLGFRCAQDLSTKDKK